METHTVDVDNYVVMVGLLCVSLGIGIFTGCAEITMETHTFDVIDYVVMVGFLGVSLGIGFYYGVGGKQTTTEEYLLGNRRLQMVPVAVSLMVSFQSAVSLMGTPAEIYEYDTMIVYTWLAILVCCVFQAYCLVPLLYPLKLVSVYEYLYKRFQSRAVQLLGACIGMLQSILYMAVVLYAPALALESEYACELWDGCTELDKQRLESVQIEAAYIAFAGFPFWLSILLMGLIGTIYTSLGGMRSVIWTDVFQCIVLYGGLIVIIVLGSTKIGGFLNMFTIADDGKRINFSSTSFDPRVRHTVWSCFIGGIFIWLPQTCCQASIQRISSMKTQTHAKNCMLLNVPLLSVYLALITLTGLLAYSYFQVQQCDPLLAGYISNANQLMPYFVMYVLRNAKGLAGVYIAALFSGSLSTFSSGINGMAANTLQDILVNYFKDKEQRIQTVFAKVIVVVYGVFAVALAFLIKKLPGPVTQISYTVSGGAGGPLVGVILLGAFFPQANWIGALCGGVIGIAVNVWIGVGGVVYGKKATSNSTPISTSGCYDLYSFNTSDAASTITSGTNAYTQSDMTTAATRLSSIDEDSHLLVYDLSYAYLGMIGLLVCIVSGLIVSYCTGKDSKTRTDPSHVIPFVRRWTSRYRPTFEYGTKQTVYMEEYEAPLPLESLKYRQKHAHS